MFISLLIWKWIHTHTINSSKALKKKVYIAVIYSFIASAYDDFFSALYLNNLILLEFKS